MTRQPTDQDPSHIGGASGRRERGRTVATLGALVVMATVICGACTTPKSRGAGTPTAADAMRPAPLPTSGTDLKVLVISADGTEPDYLAITDALGQTGIPFERFVVAERPMTGGQFASMLSDSPEHARFNSIVLATGNLVARTPQPNNPQVRLSDEERDALIAYQAKFAVRSVTVNTYPDPSFGLRYVGYLAPAVPAARASLTDAGRTVFPNINPSVPLPIEDAGIYLGEAVDPAATTTLMTVPGPDGSVHPLVSTTRFPDGHENLAITAGNGPQFTHSILMSYGWIDWVTKGLHLGTRRPSLDVQVDDLFLTVALWDSRRHRVGTRTHRNVGTDIEALVNWQRERRALPTTPDLTMEFAFVGSGTNPGRYPEDTLLAAVRSNRREVRFINHTFSHYDLDCGATATCGGRFSATDDEIIRDITQNIDRGRTLGLHSDWETMVQPDVSGVNNIAGSSAATAAADAGIRYWISDAARPGGGNPAFNVGFRVASDRRIYVVPRHATDLFYDDSTPEEWVDEFNHVYGPGGTLCETTTCFAAPLTYAEILDHESDTLLHHLLVGDNDPLMFHTPNTHAYDSTHSLLVDLLDATLAKYDALTTTAIASPTFRQVGLAQQERGNFDSAAVRATVSADHRVTVYARRGAVVPVTGVRGADAVRDVTGSPVSRLSLAAGQSVTVDAAVRQ